MKVSIQDFYQNYYDTQVFQQDAKWTIIDMSYDSSVRIDNIFGSVEKDAFRREMIALNMELIETADLVRVI